VLGACFALLIANLVRMIGGVIAITILIASERSRKQFQQVAPVGDTLR
jgi:hypothetical protein